MNKIYDVFCVLYVNSQESYNIVESCIGSGL